MTGQQPQAGPGDVVVNWVGGDSSGVLVQATTVRDLTINQPPRRSRIRRRRLDRVTRRDPAGPCVGRDREMATLRERLAAGRSVFVHGPHGIGKTFLLDHAAAAGIVAADTVPGCAGVLWLDVRDSDVDDVLRALFVACYTADPAMVLPRAEVVRRLAPIRALVVLDLQATTWSADDLRAVRTALPDSVFVIASTQLALAAEIPPLEVAALTPQEGLELLTARLGEPLAPRIAGEIDALCHAYRGNPSRFVRLAARLGQIVAGAAEYDCDPLPEELYLVVPGQIEALEEPAALMLAALATLPGVSWGADLLCAVAGTETVGYADRLVEDGLALREPPADPSRDGVGRYRIECSVIRYAPTAARALVIEGITDWVRSQPHPRRIADEITVIDHAVRHTRDAGDYAATMSLARAAIIRLPDLRWHAAHGRVLAAGLAAATATGSLADRVAFGGALATHRAANDRTEEGIELLIGIAEDCRSAGDERLAADAVRRCDLLRAGHGRTGRPPGATGVASAVPHRVAQLVRAGKAVVDAVGRAALRLPGVYRLAAAVGRLGQNHPNELKAGLTAVVLVAGYFLMPSSASRPTATGVDPGGTGFQALAGVDRHVDDPAGGTDPTVFAPDAAPATTAPGPPTAGAPVAPPPATARPAPPAPRAPTSGGTGTANPPPPRATTSTTAPPSGYATAPDLTGYWRLDFVRTNFGANPGQDDVYGAGMVRLPATLCPTDQPCYGGDGAHPWHHDGRVETNNLVMTATVAGGAIELAATEAGTSCTGHYTGTAPNVVDPAARLRFTGDWECDPSGPPTWRATFTLTRTSTSAG